ncbi:hypothetical protein CHS0354_025635 [Potamilus streckersoni]|uniref:Uncharacterized protein n=1 Tax=Potamilus streckersoni TaxID=2493646 RepID=A0AAE0VNL8_9BIVA|nr:hypothetical protein CHS0354_025635 [Potamilus streckersoni]
MFILHFIFFSLTIYSVSEGRIVSGIIGQNVFLEWTFNINKTDVIYILHNGTPIHQFFPNNNSSQPRKPPQRGSFTVDYTTPEKITVIINFIDLTRNDTGTYRVVRQWNLEDLSDRIDLQTSEISYYTATGVSGKVDTEGSFVVT